MFCSYHFTTLDGKFNGFGNYVGEFHMEIYEGQLEKFILDLEKTLKMVLEQQLGKQLAVKVLYFK